jgi:hypothetical protein
MIMNCIFFEILKLDTDYFILFFLMFFRLTKYFSFFHYVDRLKLLTVKTFEKQPWKQTEFNIQQNEFEKFQQLYQFYVTNKTKEFRRKY